MNIPPLGKFWASRQLRGDEPLDTIRAATTRHFDNAARLRSESALRQRWEMFGSYVAPRFLPLLEEDPRGGVHRYPLDVCGTVYNASVGSIEFAAMAAILIPIIEEHAVASVVEIGGGYGGLAVAVARTLGERRPPWASLDVESACRVADWYGQPFFVGAGGRYNPIPWAVLGDAPLAQMPGLAADLLVQTRGFMEMSPAELRFYFDLIQNGTLLKPNGLMWTINRLEKVSRFIDYPWDDRWFLIDAQRWPEHDMVRCLLQRTPTSCMSVAKQLALLQPWTAAA